MRRGPEARLTVYQDLNTNRPTWRQQTATDILHFGRPDGKFGEHATHGWLGPQGSSNRALRCFRLDSRGKTG